MGAVCKPVTLRAWTRANACRFGLSEIAKPRTERSIARRQGWVWPAIRAVLLESERALSPAEIHVAVAEAMNDRVAKSTIKNEMRRRLRAPRSELAQDIDGGYRLVSDDSGK